jgi:hypothetical protein
MFVTNNDVTGRRLIGINERFSENAGEDVAGEIDHWSNDTLFLHVYHQNYEHPKDTFVVKTEYQLYDGIIIKRIYEQPIVGGGYGDEVEFDSLKIENNRIKFYGAKSKFDKNNLPRHEINFPSGEVVVYSDSSFVTKIEIDKQYKDMDFSRIDNSGKRIYHQPEVEIKTYVFMPRRKLNLNSIGEIGVFREVKSKASR